MRVWLATIGEPLPIDPGKPRLLRAGILAKVMTERGHEVTWWTSTFDHAKKRQRRCDDSTVAVDNITIRMLHGCGYSKNVSLRRFLNHELVARKFRAFAASARRPDIVLCSYPTIELAREAVRYGICEKVPVLLDIRDAWPDAIFELLPWRLRSFGRNILFWLSAQGDDALRRCTGIVGISDDYLEWGLTHAGRVRTPSDGVYPLSYVIPEHDAQGLALATEKMAAKGVDARKVLVWYIGTFGRTYDLVPVIRAAKMLEEDKQTGVQFVISGGGEEEQRLRELASGLTNIVFTGWIDTAEIAWLREHAAIGLQPYAKGAPQGLANKLFEYISAGLPVVSSLGGENEALIRVNGCGLTYAAGDAESFLEQLQLLIDNPTLRKDMGLRAKRLFEERYSPEKVYGALASHLEHVAKHKVGKSLPLFSSNAELRQ